MAELTPPVLIDEHGDISVYASSERAASHLEAIDVLNGEYARSLRWRTAECEGWLTEAAPRRPLIAQLPRRVQ